MEELLQQMIAYAGEDYDPEQDSLLMLLLEDAIEEVVNHMYPFGAPEEYEETSTDENGDVQTVTVYPAREKALKKHRALFAGLQSITTTR